MNDEQKLGGLMKEKINYSEPDEPERLIPLGDLRNSLVRSESAKVRDAMRGAYFVGEPITDEDWNNPDFCLAIAYAYGLQQGRKSWSPFDRILI